VCECVRVCMHLYSVCVCVHVRCVCMYIYQLGYPGAEQLRCVCVCVCVCVCERERERERESGYEWLCMYPAYVVYTKILALNR
jgi:hypothetical protein